MIYTLTRQHILQWVGVNAEECLAVFGAKGVAEAGLFDVVVELFGLWEVGNGVTLQQTRSHLVGVEHLVGLVYAAVDKGSHLVGMALGGLQFGEGKRWTDGKVDVSFVFGDTADDALAVFARGFLVRASTAETEFAGFEGCTGLPLVGDAQWDDVHVGKGMDRVAARSGNHLDEGGVGMVYAVLGAPVTLGNPNALPFKGYQAP